MSFIRKLIKHCEKHLWNSIKSVCVKSEEKRRKTKRPIIVASWRYLLHIRNMCQKSVCFFFPLLFDAFARLMYTFLWWNSKNNVSIWGLRGIIQRWKNLAFVSLIIIGWFWWMPNTFYYKGIWWFLFKLINWNLFIFI